MNFPNQLKYLYSIIVGFVYLFTTSCSNNLEVQTTSHYGVEVNINTEKQALNAKVNILYVPTQSIHSDSLEFIVHENAILKSPTAEGLINYVEKEKSNKLKSVTLNFKQQIEKPITIVFEYDFVLKKGDAPWGIDKISEDWIELSLNSTWLPIISSYSNQFSAKGDISITSKNKFDLISSGTTQKLRNNTFKITNITPQADFVLIGSSSINKSTQGDITIYDSKINPERNAFIHDLSKKSFEWLNTKFSQVKKLPQSKLVITPRKESGYARKNLIILSNDISTKDTLHFVNYITHEFAHFWSSGANPLTEHRWLDESVAEYVAWKFIDKEYKKEYLEKFLSNAEKEADTIPAVYVKGVTKVPQHAVMYRKGVYKLFKLEQQIGENNMFLLLSNWFKVNNKNSEHFLELLEKTNGNQVAENFRLGLSR